MNQFNMASTAIDVSGIHVQAIENANRVAGADQGLRHVGSQKSTPAQHKASVFFHCDDLQQFQHVLHLLGVLRDGF